MSGEDHWLAQSGAKAWGYGGLPVGTFLGSVVAVFLGLNPGAGGAIGLCVGGVIFVVCVVVAPYYEKHEREQAEANNRRSTAQGGAPRFTCDRCFTVVPIKPQPSVQTCDGCGTVWVAEHDDVRPRVQASTAAAQAQTADTKREMPCPFCNKLVKVAATARHARCRNCGRVFEP